MGERLAKSPHDVIATQDVEAPRALTAAAVSQPSSFQVMYSSADFYETMDGKEDGRPRCWLVSQSRQAARVWRGLPSACRALLAVGLLNMALTLAYSATGFAAGEEGERVHFSVSTVVAAIGVWLCLIDAVVFENTFEMFGVVLVGVLILLRVLWVLIRNEAPFFLILVWGVILSVTQVAELVFCLLAHRQFGWRVLSHTGFDVRSEGRGAKMRAAVVANAFTAAYRLLLILVMIMTTVTIVASVEGPPSTRAALIVTSAVGFAATVVVILVCLYAVARATRRAAAAEEAPLLSAGVRASRRRLDGGDVEEEEEEERFDAAGDATNNAPRNTDPASRRRVSLDAAIFAGAEGGKPEAPEREAPNSSKALSAASDADAPRGLGALWARARRHAWWLDLCLVVLLYQPLATIVLCTNDDGYWTLSAKLVMYILASICILATGLLFLLLHAVLAHRRHVAFSHGRIKLRAARLPASQSAGAARGALLPLQAGAWLGKPSASRPDKLRFFQLSRDASTLRWGWHKYLRLFHVETIAADRAARTLTLRFVADAPLLLRFPDALTLTVWERGLSAAMEVVLAPEDGEAEPPRAPAAADDEAVGLWWAVGEGLERALRLRGPLEDEEASRIERHRKRKRARGDSRSATLDHLLKSLASGAARRERRAADGDADTDRDASGDEPAPLPEPLPEPRRAARPALASLRERGSGLRQTLLGWMSGVSSGGEAEDGRKLELIDLEAGGAGGAGAATVVIDDAARRQSRTATSGNERLPGRPSPDKFASAAHAPQQQSALQAREASESRDAGVAALYFAAIADCGEFGLVLPSGLSIGRRERRARRAAALRARRRGRGQLALGADAAARAAVGDARGPVLDAARGVAQRVAGADARGLAGPGLHLGGDRGARGAGVWAGAGRGRRGARVCGLAPGPAGRDQGLRPRGGRGARGPRVFNGRAARQPTNPARPVPRARRAAARGRLLPARHAGRAGALLGRAALGRGAPAARRARAGGRRGAPALARRAAPRPQAQQRAGRPRRGRAHRRPGLQQVRAGRRAGRRQRGRRAPDAGRARHRALRGARAGGRARRRALRARPARAGRLVAGRGALGDARAAPAIRGALRPRRAGALGAAPGRGRAAAAARAAHRRRRPARAVAHVAAELTRLCADCMAYAPERRPTAEQVLRRVERLEAGLGAGSDRMVLG
ncbi:hypothetical protein QBZ16_000772 [Prototheca wickerhamii]|uniref:Uncharacterized protein n=1 Tax=Prototheca wickerhamii TaxID=3111 RepID=A0AAD9IM40_PROWI|nr:hypothetical protein QBZ16_000772 [Prototheca wickerhamii]